MGSGFAVDKENNMPEMENLVSLGSFCSRCVFYYFGYVDLKVTKLEYLKVFLSVSKNLKYFKS